MRHLGLLVAAGLLCAGCGMPRRRPTLRGPELFECRRAAGKITIDGHLDEAAWKAAQEVWDFRVPGSAAKPQAPTAARFLWDDQFLYVGVKLVDRDVYGTKTEHDSMTWEDDVAELFFKPRETRHVYYEFHVNPLGTTLDLRFGRRGAGSFDRWRAWDSGMKAKVDVQGTLNKWDDKDKGWVAELAIPLRAFTDATPKVQLGDRWRFAVCRYNYSVHLEDKELSSSAPLRRSDFHRFEDYDFIEFVE